MMNGSHNNGVNAGIVLLFSTVVLAAQQLLDEKEIQWEIAKKDAEIGTVNK